MTVGVRDYIFLALLTLIGIFIFFPHLSRPFVGLHDFNGVFYGQIAKNYLRYGGIETKLGQITGTDSEGFFRYHINHPATLPLMIAGLYRFFGVSEAVTRIIPVSFSVLSLIFVYLIGSMLSNRLVGGLAAIFVAVTTMFQYFGKTPVFEPLVLTIGLFGIMNYIQFIQKGSSRHLFFIGVSVVFGLLVDWTGFYLLPLLTLHALFVKRKRELIRAFFFLWIAQLFIFALLLTHVYILTGSVLGSGLWSSLLYRLAVADQGLHAFTPMQFISTVIGYLRVYFSQILLVFSGMWLFRSIILRGKHQFFQTSIVWLIFIYGVIHPLLNRNGTYTHEYMLYYLLPFIGISSALFLWDGSNFFQRRRLAFIVMGLLIFLLARGERYSFLETLHTTDYFRPGYELGNIAKDILDVDDVALVGSNQFGSFFLPFAAYYGDRTLVYTEPSLQVWIENEAFYLDQYDYVIQVKTHDYLDPLLVQYLEQRYLQLELGDFRFFRLHDTV